MHSKSSAICILATLCMFTVSKTETLSQFCFIDNILLRFVLTPLLLAVSFVSSTNAEGAFPAQVSTAPQSYASTGFITRFPTSKSSSNLATGFSSSNQAVAFSSSGSSATNQAIAFSTSGSATKSSQVTTSNSPTATSTLQSGLKFPTESSRTISENTKQPPVSPVIDEFIHSINQGLVSSETLKNFANFQLQRPNDLFFNYGYNVLTNAGIYDPELANLVSQSVESVGVLPSPLFYDATAKTLAKYLYSAGLLNGDTASSLARNFLDLVEKHAESSNGGAESLISAVGDAFFHLFHSLGLLNSNEDFARVFSLFAREIIERPS